MILNLHEYMKKIIANIYRNIFYIMSIDLDIHFKAIYSCRHCKIKWLILSFQIEIVVYSHNYYRIVSVLFHSVAVKIHRINLHIECIFTISIYRNIFICLASSIYTVYADTLSYGPN